MKWRTPKQCYISSKKKLNLMHYYAGESNVMNNQGGQDLKLFFIKSINDFSFYSLPA